MAAVKVEKLVKTYGAIKALKSIDINLPKGIIFGLLGPNGAGKSTFIKILAGALKPTSGNIEVLGLNPISNRHELSRKLGYMPQGFALYEDLSARENLRFFGSLQKTSDLENKINKTLEFTELVDRADDKVCGFSGGMKKRISLACSFIHDPDIIFLDEPTAAVDPHLKVKTWQLFRKLRDQGVTLIVSTHLMDEALLCDRLAIISQGDLIAYDTPQNILEKGNVKVELEKNGKKIERTSGGLPKDLANILHEFGLEKEIDKITVEHDSLESIILRLLEQEVD